MNPVSLIIGEFFSLKIYRMVDYHIFCYKIYFVIILFESYIS